MRSKVHNPQQRQGFVRRAFTVVELLLVVLIMSIVAVLCIDMIAGFEANQRAERAARESLGAFRYARTLAITTGCWTEVVISTTNRTLSVYQQQISGGAPVFSGPTPTYSTTPVVTGLTSSGTWVINMNNSRELAGTSFSASPATITTFNFSPIGNCMMNTGPSTALATGASPTTITFSYGGRTKTLTVKQVGDPTIQ